MADQIINTGNHEPNKTTSSEGEHTNTYDCFERKLQNSIRFKARKLVGHYGFTESDIPDIEQELAIEVFLKQSSFDKLRAKLATFIDRVCENKIRDIIRERTADCRDVMKTNSLHEELEFESTKIYKIDNLAAPKDCYPGMHMDVEAFFQSLSPEENELLMQLRDMSQTAIAKATGTSLSTVNYRVSQLREKIQNQDFFGFL